MKQIMLVGIGGFMGSIARFLISKLNSNIIFYSLPIGTLIVNILGSFIIGIIAGLPIRYNWLSSDFKLFLMIGVCGGFTTFSSFSNENYVLMQNGEYGIAFTYSILSVILGIGAVVFGHYLSNSLN
jgi:CrcB protein